MHTVVISTAVFCEIHSADCIDKYCSVMSSTAGQTVLSSNSELCEILQCSVKYCSVYCVVQYCSIL